jgi:RhoGAP domain
MQYMEYTIILLTSAGMETEGIYRLSGQNSKVAQLLKCCQNGEKITSNLFTFINVLNIETLGTRVLYIEKRVN